MSQGIIQQTSLEELPPKPVLLTLLLCQGWRCSSTYFRKAPARARSASLPQEGFDSRLRIPFAQPHTGEQTLPSQTHPVLCSSSWLFGRQLSEVSLWVSWPQTLLEDMLTPLARRPQRPGLLCLPHAEHKEWPNVPCGNLQTSAFCDFFWVTKELTYRN